MTARRAIGAILMVIALAGAADPGDDERRTAEMLGVLLYTPVTLDLDRTPARRAFDLLAAQLDVVMVGRYDDGRLGYGIDPKMPLTLQVEGIPALDALEHLLAQCESAGSQCTWQMRRGFVEFGTKSRLSVPAARERRTYYLADLIIDVPDTPLDRTRHEVLALDQVQAIVETIEPDAWDWGQIDYDSEDDSARLPAPQTLSGGTVPAAALPPPPAPSAGTATATAAPRRYVRPRKIAIIRYWRDVLIIDAPDYIHRQVGGYPAAIRPDELTPATSR